MRYAIIRPRASRWDDLQETPLLEGRTVYELDEPVDTGLLDKDGNSIGRRMDPIGFIHFDGVK